MRPRGFPLGPTGDGRARCTLAAAEEGGIEPHTREGADRLATGSRQPSRHRPPEFRPPGQVISTAPSHPARSPRLLILDVRTGTSRESRSRTGALPRIRRLHEPAVLFPGALGGTRTPNFLIRNQALCPLRYERIARCPRAVRGPSAKVTGLEPAISWLTTRCHSSWATPPSTHGFRGRPALALPPACGRVSLRHGTHAGVTVQGGDSHRRPRRCGCTVGPRRADRDRTCARGVMSPELYQLSYRPVGVTGVEPAASRSRTARATKLRHTPEGPVLAVQGRSAVVVCTVAPRVEHRPEPAVWRGFVGVQGLEPRPADPESAALPVAPYPKGVPCGTLGRKWSDRRGSNPATRIQRPVRYLLRHDPAVLAEGVEPPATLGVGEVLWPAELHEHGAPGGTRTPTGGLRKPLPCPLGDRRTAEDGGLEPQPAGPTSRLPTGAQLTRLHVLLGWSTGIEPAQSGWTLGPQPSAANQ